MENQGGDRDMTQLRERIERVLKTYGVSSLLTENSSILDALVAQYPKEPNKAELRRLFAKHHQSHPNADSWREALIDDICAWASGETKREWCKHWKWDSVLTNYAQVTDTETTREAHDYYKFCEYCGAPRPS
jgi:hypothetical protein